MKLALSLLFLLASQAMADKLEPFTTDGCSMFPDGNLKNNSKWAQCCIKHDYAYWKGGSYTEREQADKALKRCVANLGEENLAVVMHFGVKFGGEPFYPTGYRWGYGWPYSRGYQALSESEKTQVQQRLIEFRTMLDQFIENETQTAKK